MLKQILLVSALASILSCGSYAATIAFGAAQDNGFSDSQGQELEIGNIVQVGVFTTGANEAERDNAIVSGFGSPAFFTQNFVSLGTARIGDVFGTPSNFQGVSNVDTTPYVGQQLYMVALRSTDTSTAPAAMSTARDIGVYYLSLSVNTSWAVPPQNPVPGSTAIDLSDLTNPAGNALVNGARVLVGRFPLGASTAGGAPNFGLAPVPEPSS